MYKKLAENIIYELDGTTDITKMLKEEVESTEEKIENLKELLQKSQKSLFTLKDILAKEEAKSEDKNENPEISRIQKELENIANLEEVVEVSLCGDSNISVVTNQINITDEEGNMFIGNDYEIILDIKDNMVRIYGNRDYQGYWSNRDPHPHVSGENGLPCLGSVSASIAYTIEERNYYCALLLVLEFLKQVNVEDAAGKYIKYYTQIDEDGNEIENVYTKYKRCCVCGVLRKEEEMNVCVICGEYICEDHTEKTVDDEPICEECVDNRDTRHCENCGRVIDLDSDIYIKDISGESYYCCDCAENEDRCFGCGNIFERYHDRFNVQGDEYCEDCLENEISNNMIKECVECGLHFYTENMICDYCKECYEDIKAEKEEEQTVEETNGSRCEICGEEMTEEYISPYGEIICKKCFDNGRGC